MIDIKEIERPVALEMCECRKRYESLLSHENPYLDEILAYVASYNGKMLRPLLVLLCGKLLKNCNLRTQSMALAIEFFHTASLLHDDIVDDSDERRGNKSVRVAFDNKSAVLVGDYLLATSLKCVALTEKPQLMSSLSVCAQQMTDGELLQLHHSHLLETTEEDYFKVIERKTAELFAVCTESAALCADADQPTVERLRLFGRYLGICFQLKDDILDYVGDAKLGKPVGNDLVEGKMTLPLLHALHVRSDSSTAPLIDHMQQGKLTQEEAATLIDFTVQAGGILYAQQVMNTYALKAKETLAPFFGSEEHLALMRYVDYVVARVY